MNELRVWFDNHNSMLYIRPVGRTCRARLSMIGPGPIEYIYPDEPKRNWVGKTVIKHPESFGYPDMIHTARLLDDDQYMEDQIDERS